MKKLNEISNGNFNINCTCGNKNCDFEFTETSNIVIYCKICGNTELMIKNEKN